MPIIVFDQAMILISLLLITQFFVRISCSYVVGCHQEGEALLKFRERIPDCLTDDYQDDEFLLRWLRVEKFDVDKAEEKLRKSMEWRRRWRVDELRNLELPEIFKRYLTHGLSGFDKEGAPVIIVPFLHLDASGLFECVGHDELITGAIKVIEDYQQLARKQALEFGPNAGRIFCIVDMTDYHFKFTSYTEVGKLGRKLIQMYKDNYPDAMKNCFLINATYSFRLAYRTITGFLGNLKNHITMYKPSQIVNAKKDLLKLIDADQLPAYFGGTMTDPDGNPKCITKINYGGNVSQEYRYPMESRLIDQVSKLEMPEEEKSDMI